MKYLKKFSIRENFGVATEFDNEALEQVKMIFSDFAEDHNFYKYKWSIVSYPTDADISYTYFTWIDLQYEFPRNKMAEKIYREMLEKKYFQILINVNQNMNNYTQIKDFGDSKKRDYQPFNDVISDIEGELIPHLESLGYKIDINYGCFSSLDIYTHQISLKIDYSNL